MSVTREHVPACVHDQTYKYFLPMEAVMDTWCALSRRYGDVRLEPHVGTMSIETDALLIRASRLANPLTLIRKRPCTDHDVDEFHDLVQFRARP